MANYHHRRHRWLALWSDQSWIQSNKTRFHALPHYPTTGFHNIPYKKLPVSAEMAKTPYAVLYHIVRKVRHSRIVGKPVWHQVYQLPPITACDHIAHKLPTAQLVAVTESPPQVVEYQIGGYGYKSDCLEPTL